MKGSAEVIKALQATLALEAHLNIQYRNDWRVLKFMHLHATAGKIKSLGTKAHQFMKLAKDRLLVLGAGTDAYSMAPIVTAASLTEIFANELTLEQSLAAVCTQAIATAVAQRDEDTAEKLRHIEERHEDAIGWIEQQQRLMASMGGEAEYIQAYARK